MGTGYFEVTACDVLDREHGAQFVIIKLVEVFISKICKQLL